MRTEECSLNVSVTSHCHDASCRDVVPTFESAGQQKKKGRKKETKIRQKGLMSKSGQKEQRKMNKERLKD